MQRSRQLFMSVSQKFMLCLEQKLHKFIKKCLICIQQGNTTLEFYPEKGKLAKCFPLPCKI